MIQLKPENIFNSSFHNYGRYIDLLHPQGPYLGERPIRFFRDMMPLGESEVLSLSITAVEPTPLVVDMMEYHSKTSECFLTLDSDTYIVVAPASADEHLDCKTLEAFFVPKGTAVYIHPGVWHYAPFPAEEKEIHSLVMLPQRTYANDCYKMEIVEKAELV